MAGSFTRKWENSIALHANVSLKNPFSEDFPAKGPATLTDGMLGDKDFSTNWLFFYGTDMVATIDLGENKTINQVQMNFLQDAKHFIFNPTNIIVETSQDGRNFKTVGKQQPDPLQDGDYNIKPNNYSFKVSAVQARYVRVTGTCLPALPSWRLWGNKKPALCCDEIIVL
ncbi:discoidin domain-containing protein [Chitinophaga pinensis]|uniref:Discoidin domain-containing protein n=1 Tax=Chitinophaga pinensis TaxID=79329 RepID=A0A5C6LNU1_9BACT|nr:discoidin domain-containing protein [Chitinophaga pinensis]TWV96822.1 discoidin domain-containing protein [Chitinophaga pinensis]